MANKESPEFRHAEFKNAIKLSELKQKKSSPPSYHSHMAEKETHQHIEAALPAQPKAKRSAKQAEANYPCTHEDILYEHVLARRLDTNYALREYEGDVVVNWCVAITKTLTVIFLIFMIVYTAWSWWSLGPHYARNYRDPDSALQDTGSSR